MTPREAIEQAVMATLGEDDVVIADAIRSRLESAGYAVVPIEPTEAMIVAAHASTARWLGLPGPKMALSQAYAKHAHRYRAMLAARPK